MTPPRLPLRPLDEALDELMAYAVPLARHETVSTFEADGRVLVHDLRSALQVPPQDNSAMDGYAVRHAEVTSADAFVVSQRIPAGSPAQSSLTRGSGCAPSSAWTRSWCSRCPR